MPNLMQDLGTKIGGEFKTHRLRIENVESTKVDKVVGKQLSTEDFTSALKTKLDGIATGAEVNVNADWSAVSGDAAILNKPTTLGGYGITNAYTKTEVDTIVGDVNSALDTINGEVI